MNNIVLEISGLNKTFKNRKVINDLNLKVVEGDIYGFIGPNGSGKTTTIRTILGLLRPDSGKVIIDGYDTKRNYKKAISSIGAIVGNPVFYEYLSAYDNLSLMSNLIPETSKERIEEFLEIVGLKERSHDKVQTYSLGMKQRLGIANALLNNPKLIILDEPTNGLDPQGMKEFKELIAQLAIEKGITFFISSHLLNEVEQICNKVGIFKEGKLLAERSTKEFLLEQDEIYEIYTSELNKVKSILKAMSYVKSLDDFPNGIIVQTEKGSFSSLNKLLVTNDIPFDSLIPKRNTLENYFLDITGGGHPND